MATAKVTNKIVIEEVTLVLTEDEARWLRTHLGQMSGGESYTIFEALSSAGVPKYTEE